LQTQIDQARASVNRNYGPDDVLISLRQQCFEVKIEKYVYKACPFGEAHQDSVRLGTNTDGVEISPLTGDMMLKFTNGATCWNGPNRSLSLTLKCGDREALADVEEPSRCEYSATLFTPQACDESAVAALDAELSTLDRIIAGAGRDEL
jgi:protein kinase C substrate 80K-H